MMFSLMGLFPVEVLLKALAIIYVLLQLYGLLRGIHFIIEIFITGVQYLFIKKSKESTFLFFCNMDGEYKISFED